MIECTRLNDTAAGRGVPQGQFRSVLAGRGDRPNRDRWAQATAAEEGRHALEDLRRGAEEQFEVLNVPYAEVKPE